ncbi:pentapeptide repeat-containing protein [Amycolatopsis sp., V23-08]|uniref:Pentapeptide repeat-containing protein n=1 Tax=Amycolatopsis heterodermiae TaxID=3110235 RepID=A0ABU5QZZ5_9PSEU|nr:pentapeptide repeat-containing protein [Amycolatopsis sp., V23-08]MEA5359503.1 pentapeptide repeat-containing protein [Amycolatopsis sp., V23-08]
MVKPWRSPLAWTFAASLVLLLGVGGWLLTDPATSRSDALKTGGLAGGAIVALYALWLNDRRRRVEERRQDIERQRHELESQRAEQDRERVADERFAKAVELLGHAADQVRVGALHALAGLARNRPSYTQTVLDVLCSYLRRPFSFVRDNDSPDPKEDPEGERELTVRLTAQRLVTDLLPGRDDEGPAYDLDLTGATLEYFDLSGKLVGGLLLRYASLRSSTNFSGCRFKGRVYLTAAGAERGRLLGYFRCRGAIFESHAWFSGTSFAEDADFTQTTFAGKTTFKDAKFAKAADFTDVIVSTEIDLRRTRFEGQTDLRFASLPESVSLYNTRVLSEKDVQLPAGWAREELRDGEERIVAER